jgi:hypothetical protein
MVTVTGFFIVGSGEKRGMVAETPNYCRTGSSGAVAGRWSLSCALDGEFHSHSAEPQKTHAQVLVCSSVVCNYITKSPKHLDDTDAKEIVMNTHLSSKFAAIAAALAVNSTMIGAVAVLFNTQAHSQVVALAHVASVLEFFA